MNTLSRNVQFITRKFKLSTALNITGLSLAFAAFIIIMNQVWYDYTYESGIKDSDNIYLLYSIPSKERSDDRNFSSVSQAAISTLTKSPYIKESAFLYSGYDEMSQFYVGDQYVDATTAIVSHNFLPFFGTSLIVGNLDDFQQSGSVVIPESFALRYFGNLDVIGKTVDREKKSAIVGVYKDFPRNSSIKNAVYMQYQKSWYPDFVQTGWNVNSCKLFIKVDSPSAITGIRNFANAELDKRKKDGTDSFRESFEFIPLADTHFCHDIVGLLESPAQKSTATILLSIAITIVLIAIINFTNFANALMPIRIRSINIQKIMGATRRSLAVAITTEAVIISLVSLAVAFGIVEIMSFTSLSSLTEAGIDLTESIDVLAIAALIAIGVGVIAGILPMLRMTSYSPAVVLKGNFGLSPKGQLLRNVMIGFQFFASATLITGSIFMQKQRNHIMNSLDYGFAKDEIIVCDVKQPAQMPDDKTVVIEALRKLPFVDNASLSWSALGKDDNIQGWVFTGDDGTTVDPSTFFATEGFLQTMGIKLIEGRDFEPTDTNAIIINQLAANKYGTAVEVGHKLRFGKMSVPIIGICDNMIYSSAHNAVEPILLFKTDYYFATVNVRVKKGTNMFEAMNGIRSALEKFDPGYPFKIQFYDQIMDETYQQETKFTKQIAIFSLLAIAISIVGAFGLVMFDSEYRRREIAIRKVFGSTTTEIISMFNKKYLTILAIGYAASIPVTYYVVNRWLETFAYRTSLDWWVYALVFVGMAAITVATVTCQCRKSSKANPIESLKQE